MATKPPSADLPRWGTDGATQIATPPEAKKDIGWEFDTTANEGEKPPVHWLNWLKNKTYLWLKWVDENVIDNTNDQTMAGIKTIVDPIIHATNGKHLVRTIKDAPLAVTEDVNEYHEAILFLPSGAESRYSYSMAINAKYDEFDIIAVATGAGGVFTVTGDQTAKFPQASAKLGVRDSTGNDGVYTVDTVTLVTGDTEIKVVIGDNIPNATADGTIGRWRTGTGGAGDFVTILALHESLLGGFTIYRSELPLSDINGVAFGGTVLTIEPPPSIVNIEIALGMRSGAAADQFQIFGTGVDPQVDEDYSTKKYVDDTASDHISRTGDTMDSGADLTFQDGGEPTGLPATPGATGAASKEYVDSEIADSLNSIVFDSTLSGTLTLSTTLTDIPGASISISENGKYAIYATFDVSVDSTDNTKLIECNITVDAGTRIAALIVSQHSSGVMRITLPGLQFIEVLDGSDTFKLQARIQSAPASGNTIINVATTSIMAIKISE